MTFNIVKDTKNLGKEERENPKNWSMTKKMSSEILAVKTSRKKNVIQKSKKFFRPPQVGTRSPPLCGGLSLNL